MSLPFRTLWSLVGALISLAALQAQDVLWGVTPVGGTDGAGTVYSISTSGTYQKEHDFEVVLGNLPKSDLVLINGKYYGTTEQTSGALGGVIFSYDPVTLEYAVEAQFVSGLSGTGIAPRRGMVLASNGKLYGTCALGGPLNSLGGTIFEFDPVTKALVAKVGFGFGGQPQCRLVPNAAGNVLYGTTNLGNGTIFSYIPGQTTVTTLHTFNGSNGTDPIVGVVRSGSILYGTTQDGGTNGVGVLYSYNLSTSTFTVLHHFSTGTGSTPLGELLVLPQGIFGTTSEGASGFGAVFRYVSGGSPAYQLVHDFSSTDGAAPKSGLVRSTTDGAIYGTTSQGGTGNKGVVFSVDPVSLVLTLRAQFGTTTFGTPLAGLVQTGTNEFIGTASSGGPSGNGGAVYLFNAASNTFETLVTLGQAIGQGPSGQLCLASDGKLYGTTQQGGQFGTGVLYRIDRNTGTFQSLHDFGGLDGTGPVGGLVEVNGKLYGVCGSGGSQLGGTVFSYQPSTGTYAVIANFTNQTGKTPLAGLMQASNGQLYGTTSSGAALNGTTNGTLFSINPNLTTPTIQVRHIFDVTGTEGTNCQGPLFQASSGLLYGTCQTGGLQNTGTMFRFDTSSQIFTKLQDFIGTLNVGDPTGTLVERSNGLIYGTGSTGGGNIVGGVFSFNPSTNEILLRASFGNPNDLTDGSVPLSGLFAAPNGLYYGTCSEGGGVPNRGRVFSFNPANNVLAGLYNFQAGTDGGNPTSGFILVPPAPSAVFLDLTVLLDGPYDEGSQLMTDQLRQQGLVPLTEPYTAAGFTQVGGGGEIVAPSVLNTTGNNAIVDWVFLELRSAGDNTNVLATRSALLQRDGNVVDVDGVSPVAFQGLGPGNYFLAVRHRNHLGVMTASTLAFSANPVTVDLTSGTTATFGTNARRVRGSERTLWAGNTLPDDVVKYNAAPNDRAAILAEVGGTVLTATATGYLVEDANLDGVVSYSGAGNDSDVVLRTIDGVDPGATRAEQLP